MGRAATLLQAAWGRVHGRLRRGIRCIAERQNWVTRSGLGEIVQVTQTLRPQSACTLAHTTDGLYHQVVHFGSVWLFVSEIDSVHRSNQLVLSFFHGNERMGPDMERAIRTVQASVPRLGGVITACKVMEERLRAWGIPETKIHRIPIGADRRIFRPASTERRSQRRQELGIPADAICIGSFQKDGVGWEDGGEPKEIKGPDTFVETVRRLHADHPIHVLLTGPARGFVKAGLQKHGIPYHHTFVERYEDMPGYYDALDVYLMTGREEGGPKAIPESMASGVPLVCTRTGMAPDYITHEENGLLTDIDDVDGLVTQVARLCEQPELRTRLTQAAQATAEDLDITNVAAQYYEKVYAPLLQESL